MSHSAQSIAGTEHTAVQENSLNGLAFCPSFDSFIYNSKNEFPLAVLEKIVAAEPGKAYGSVLLASRSCTGKTHLLRALIH